MRMTKIQFSRRELFDMSYYFGLFWIPLCYTASWFGLHFTRFSWHVPLYIFHFACSTLHMHLTLCTLHIALHIVLYTLHFTCCTLHIKLCVLHFAGCTLHVALDTLYFTHCTFHTVTLYFTHCALHIALYTL